MSGKTSRFFIYRNYTIEPLFKEVPGVVFSGYEDISIVPDEVPNYIWFYSCPLFESESNLIEKLEDYKQKLKLLIASSNPTSSFLLFTITPLFNFSFHTNTRRITETISSYNRYLYELADSRNLTRVIDFTNFISKINPNDLVDWRYYFMYKSIINPVLSKSFSGWFMKQIEAIEGIRKKCIVLDLDNTLWGGVLGEDGIEGIQLGNSYPGNAYKTFQKMLFEASKHGILLAIASKNNEDDVWDAFDKHPDMILKKDNFVAWQINWNDKATNIKKIAEDLNIGTDSFLFIDDNPTEREWVKSALPEVIVLDFPPHPYGLISFFKDFYDTWLQVYDITREDKEKIQQYKTNALRQQTQKTFSNLEDYIASLDITIKITEADSFSIPRIAQLTQKTNQFNLTTRRYTEVDISSLINQGHKVYSASVVDKFGDNGITAVCIIKKISTDSVEIDSYLLSCRILGLFIEFALIKKIMNMAYESGIRNIYASYIPTSKNGQTADFYEKLGFELLEDKSEKRYLMKMQKPFGIEPYYTFKL